MKCHHLECLTDIGNPIDWSYQCSRCKNCFCFTHFIKKDQIDHLYKEDLGEGMCHQCFHNDGYDGRLWERNTIDNKCAHIDNNRTCPDSSHSSCIRCGMSYCKHHIRNVKNLDSAQKKELTKYPKAESICISCYSPHGLDTNTWLAKQADPVLSDLSKIIDEKIEALSNEINRLRSDALSDADKRISDRIAQASVAIENRIDQLSRNISNIRETALHDADQRISTRIRQVQDVVALERESTVQTFENLGKKARNSANQYVVRLAIAGMNFMLIYLLVPNISRWRALEIAEQSLTAGGIVLASIWISYWIWFSIRDKDTRKDTLLLIGAGAFVLGAKFYLGLS